MPRVTRSAAKRKSDAEVGAALSALRRVEDATDVMGQIFSHLSPTSVMSASRVNVRWSQAMRTVACSQPSKVALGSRAHDSCMTLCVEDGQPHLLKYDLVHE